LLAKENIVEQTSRTLQAIELSNAANAAGDSLRFRLCVALFFSACFAALELGGGVRLFLISFYQKQFKQSLVHSVLMITHAKDTSLDFKNLWVQS